MAAVLAQALIVLSIVAFICAVAKALQLRRFNAQPRRPKGEGGIYQDLARRVMQDAAWRWLLLAVALALCASLIR